MTQPILFIHGAGGYESDRRLADSLQQALGADYQVIYPLMPDEDSPRYDAWKREILRLLAPLEGPVILVGHSLGGSMLLKILSEEPVEASVAGVFGIAVPDWSAQGWDVPEYALREGFGSHLPDLPIVLYHSRDDEIVPVDHLALYKTAAPQIITREADGRDHQYNEDLADVASDIRRLTLR